MDTVRVNVCYRPLRIGWAIAAGDHAAFQIAAAMSYALWGGRFNPIVIVDREEAASIVEVFRCDLIVPIGSSESQSTEELALSTAAIYFPDPPPPSAGGDKPPAGSTENVVGVAK